MIERAKSALIALAAVGALVGATAALAQMNAVPSGGPMATQSESGAQSVDDAAYPFTRPNPEAEIGKLPNGLTYGVMTRAGTRQVSVILVVGAGSSNETDSE